jgi:hypothetical protein
LIVDPVNAAAGSGGDQRSSGRTISTGFARIARSSVQPLRINAIPISEIVSSPLRGPLLLGPGLRQRAMKVSAPMAASRM